MRITPRVLYMEIIKELPQGIDFESPNSENSGRIGVTLDTSSERGRDMPLVMISPSPFGGEDSTTSGVRWISIRANGAIMIAWGEKTYHYTSDNVALVLMQWATTLSMGKTANYIKRTCHEWVIKD